MLFSLINYHDKGNTFSYVGGHNTHRKLTSYSIENVPNFDHLGKLLKCQNFEKLALNCTSKYLLFIVGYHCLKMILFTI